MYSLFKKEECVRLRARNVTIQHVDATSMLGWPFHVSEKPSLFYELWHICCFGAKFTYTFCHLSGGLWLLASCKQFRFFLQ